MSANLVFDPIIFKLQSRGGISSIFELLIPDLRSSFNVIDFKYKFIDYLVPWKKVYYFSQFVDRKCESHYFFSSYLSRPNKKFRGKYFFIIHDCINEEYSSNIKRFFHMILTKRCLQRADGIIFVSEYTRIEFLKRYNLNGRCRDIVIGNPIKPDLFIPRQRILNNDGFLLFIGNRLMHYKNFDFAVRLSASAGIKLCVIGQPFSTGEMDKIKLYGIQFELHSDVDHLSKFQFLSSALALIYPSFIEGFGIPIIEAQHVFCPVISVKEADWVKANFGNSTYEMPSDFKEIDVKIMLNNLKDEVFRAELTERGKANSENFILPKIASKYKDFIYSL